MTDVTPKPVKTEQTKAREKLTNYRRPIFQTDLVVDEKFETIFTQVNEFVIEVNNWIPRALGEAAHIGNAHGNMSERKRISKKTNEIIDGIESVLAGEIAELAKTCDALGYDPGVVRSRRKSPYNFLIETNAATKTYLGWLESFNNYCRHLAILEINGAIPQSKLATEPYKIRRAIKNAIKELQTYIKEKENRKSRRFSGNF